MIVTCPKCETKFKLADEALASGSPTLKCSSCSHKWQYQASDAGDKDTESEKKEEVQDNSEAKEEAVKEDKSEDNSKQEKKEPVEKPAQKEQKKVIEAEKIKKDGKGISHYIIMMGMLIAFIALCGYGSGYI